MSTGTATLPDEIKAELEHARATLEIEQARAEAAYLQRVSHNDKLLANVAGPRGYSESFDYFGRQNDYVDPRTPYFDAGYGVPGTFDLPAMPEDTRDGRFHPFWDTMEELRVLQGTSRYLANYDAMGVSLLEGLTDHAVHTGFSYSFEPRQGVNGAEGLAAACQKILDDTFRRKSWVCLGEGEFFSESVAWGEQYAHVFDSGHGKAEIELIPVPQISEPRIDSRQAISQFEGLPELNWSFGIGTRDESPTKPVGYFHNPDNTNRNWRVLRAENVVHLKRNVPSSVKRGASDFYPLARILKKCAPLLYSMVVGGAMRASIGYITKGAPGGGALTPFGNTSTAIPGMAGIGSFDIHRPGQVKHVSGNVEILSGPMGDANEAGLVQILQAGYRLVGLRWRMPEYMSTADASSINRATSDAAESPFVRAMERRQTPYAIAYCEIGWKVIGIAADAGLLREFGIESRVEAERALTLKVQPPDVEKHDSLEDSSRNQLLVASRVMSRQTLAEKNGLKWEEEKRRIKEEEAELGPVGGPAETFAGRDPETGAAMWRPAAQQQPSQPAAPPQQQQPQQAAIAGDTDTRLNGAQITAAIDVLKSVSTKELPSIAAVQLLVGIGIDSNRANEMVRAAAAIEPPKIEPQQPKSPLPPNATEQERSAFARTLAKEILFADYP